MGAVRRSVNRDFRQQIGGRPVERMVSALSGGETMTAAVGHSHLIEMILALELQIRSDRGCSDRGDDANVEALRYNGI